MKNPFSNETVKSAAIVIGSAVAFIAISKGVTALRKKFGIKEKDAGKALFDSVENGSRGKCLNEANARASWSSGCGDACEADATRCETAG